MSQNKKSHRPGELKLQGAGVSTSDVQRQLKQLAKPVVWRVAVALAMDGMIILATML